jgi:hypothetical protein
VGRLELSELRLPDGQVGPGDLNFTLCSP